jgi:hypothetical protein
MERNNEFRKERIMIHDEKAREELERQLERTRELLEGIEAEMQEYVGLRLVHWGHVGNVGHVAEVLDEAYQFVSGRRGAV